MGPPHTKLCPKSHFHNFNKRLNVLLRIFTKKLRIEFPIETHWVQQLEGVLHFQVHSTFNTTLGMSNVD